MISLSEEARLQFANDVSLRELNNEQSFIEGYSRGYVGAHNIKSTAVSYLRDELLKKDEACQKRVDAMKEEIARNSQTMMGMQFTVDNERHKYKDLMQQVIEKESKDIDIAGRAYIVGMEAHKKKVTVTIEQYLNALGEYQKKCHGEEHPPMEELRQLIFDFEKVLSHIML